MMSFVAFGMRSVGNALKIWLIVRDNAPAHQSRLVKDLNLQEYLYCEYEMYVDIFRCLWDAVSRKRLENMTSLSRQCFSKPVGFGQRFKSTGISILCVANVLGVFRRPRDAVSKKRLENFAYLSRQCSSTPVGLGQGFLSRRQCENTGTSSIAS